MAKVIKKFVDKQTKKKYRPGDEYEGAKVRIEQLVKLGFVAAEGKKDEDPKE